MYRQNNELVYSPSDLNAFLDNECVTWLSRFNLEYPGELTANEAADEDVLIQGAGDEHERTYLVQVSEVCQRSRCGGQLIAKIRARFSSPWRPCGPGGKSFIRQGWN